MVTIVRSLPLMPPNWWMTPIGPQPKLGRTMKRLRLGSGLSQDAVEAALGIDQSVLSAYERDARVPRGPVLRRIAEFYGRPVDELVTIARDDQDRREDWEASLGNEPDYEPIPGPSVAIPNDPELIEAVKALYLLETHQLPRATRTIRMIAENNPKDSEEEAAS